MTHNTNGKARYMPGLDGLRALSVLAVIAYHLNWQGVPGGFLGVGVFFVLSGYLITDQLVSKWQQDRRIDLKSFWIRRARRLLPPMLLMTAAVSVWLAIADPSRLRSLGGDIGSAVLYVNNWWLIFHKVSYFESFGPPSPFGHFWSLAVEEQFYLIWPIVLLVLLRLVPRRGKLAAWMLAGAAASALLMALLYSPGSDPSRVYYGSDTRVFGLLIGAALAVVWPSRQLSEKVPDGVRWALDGIGALSLLAILFMIASVGEYDSFVYRGGLLLLSALTAIVVAAVAHPASRLGRMLSGKPLRWIGARSYGLYLWHFPVIALTTPVSDAGSFNPTRAALQTAASFALAALSWKLVEEPILRGWKRRTSATVAASRENGKGRRPAVTLLSAGLTLVLCVSCGGTGGTGTPTGIAAGAPAESADASGTATPPAAGAGQTEPPKDHDGQTETAVMKPPKTDTASPSPAGKPNASAAGTKTDNSDAGVKTGNSDAGTKPAGGSGNGAGAKPSGGVAPISKGGEASGTKSSGGDSDLSPISGKGVTAIGDSVLLGVKPYLEKQLTSIIVDAKVGRQLSQAGDTVDALDKAGKLGDIVILELGTNGPFTKKKLDALLDSLGQDRNILLVNTRVPRKWQDDVNGMLKEAASDYDNVTLVDWYAASADQDAYFGKDGVHPTRTGAEAYAAMLEKAVAKLHPGGSGNSVS
ncbi:acyltransferase family protein [Cohnella zeiphila]|uniref:Acyltransferase family protein n=1 Tax=Cohnella zeiphila TaxID=2761120 RepID=A0A7X0SS75_9BACL|nr:acyltransferase family protein [Cohnella zeiphila]MBB6735178.1 acyltransferase family protein [Cohnella zeiphila]